MVLVTLRKGNHAGRGICEKGPKKSFVQKRERGSLQRPHEEAEIQRTALRRGKNVAFSEDTCLEKEKVRSKVTPRKVGVGLKRMRESSKRRLGWRLAWWGFTEKEALHFVGLRGRHQYLNQRSHLCVASTPFGTEGVEDQMAGLSA